MEKKIVYQGGSGEIVEKKSRFLADVFPVSSPEEAEELLEKVKKKYWDARHHCWAYVLGGDPPAERMSDDGEPSGTAGKPILEVIRGQGLSQILVVVTRYFGGTLLGTGGLVRAYTLAAQEGIANAEILTKKEGVRLSVITDYTGLGKLQYLLGQKKIPLGDCEYGEQVTLRLVCAKEEAQELAHEITEASSGQAKITKEGDCFYAKETGLVLEP